MTSPDHPTCKKTAVQAATETQGLSSPDHGPRLLFFTGGTALNEMSQVLPLYTRNSIHLLTPFDSGGSSAVLRHYFQMPAIGDLRNRLMALANRSLPGFLQVHELFAYRLPQTASSQWLHTRLHALADGQDPLMMHLDQSLRATISHHLQFFMRTITSDFDLRGACLGNLILAASYLENNRHIDTAVTLYADLVHAQGKVHLIVNANLQLRAILENGKEIIGQHRITGKEVPPLTSPIKKLSLMDPDQDAKNVRPLIRSKIRTTINSADLICYPIGSFYSSLLANLLPAGVGQAISQTPCLKIFIPNPGPDPESLGLNLFDQVQALLWHLRQDAPLDIQIKDVLNLIMLDTNTKYAGDMWAEKELTSLGIQVMRAPLLLPQKKRIDPHRLSPILMDLAKKSN